jgi:hypothetical protein
MWRHLLYLVGTLGTAFLAALLIALVVEPRLAGSVMNGRFRQVSALVSLVPVVGTGYVMYCWLQHTLATRGHLGRR